MKTKRFYSIVLALTLCLSLFPVSAEGGTPYDLWVRGVKVTSANASNVLGDSRVSYNAATNILTLNGANISKEVTEVPEGESEDEFGNVSHKNCGIYYDGNNPLTVELVNNNSITTTTKTSIEDASVVGFFSKTGVTFTGAGSLTVTAGDETNKVDKCYGICVVGKSVIEAGTTVKAIAKSASDDSYGFFAINGLDVNGNLIGKGGSAKDTEGISVRNGMIVNDGATVKAEGGKGRESTGLNCASYTDTDVVPLTVNGGSVMATGGEVEDCSGDYNAFSCGIFVNYYNKNNKYATVIKGGVVTAKGGDITSNYENISSNGISSDKIEILGGVVNATGGVVTNNYSGSGNAFAISYGISGRVYESIKIEGDAIVNAKGMDASCTDTSARCNSYSGGIRAFNSDLTIGGNAKVNASSGDATIVSTTHSTVSRAIFAPKVIINGGTVTATAGKGESSSGIGNDVNASIYVTINGGTVTATAGEGKVSCGIGHRKDSTHKITINGGIVTAIGNNLALSNAANLGTGVVAIGSASTDGNQPDAYSGGTNYYYKWFKSKYIAPNIYTISLSPNSYNFTEQSEGYSSITPVSVTVTNTGTGATSELNLAVDGTHSAFFTCAPSSITNIAPNETATFTVAPISGLNKGTYTARVKITGRNDISADFLVSFKVNSLGGSGDTGDTGGGSTGGESDTGSTGGGGTSPAPVAEETIKAELSDDKNQEKIEVKIDEKKGTALVELKEAKKFSGKEIAIKMPKIKNVTKNILAVPVEALSKKAQEGSITFETPIASVVLPSNMLTDIEKITGKKAEISMAEAKKSDLPIVSFDLSVDKVPFNWKSKAAALRVSIPYTPSEKELKNLDRITAYYIDDGGKLIEMEAAKYDPKVKAVVFTTTHLGNYTVGHKEDKEEVKEELSFSDVGPDDWYYDAVKFIVGRNITKGTGNDKFSPKAPLNRAEFIVMLMRSYGLEPDEASTNNFADAGNSYYTNYLAAAKRLGIAKGVGQNKFAPEAEISREAMFTLLYNALKELDKLPKSDSEKTLEDFGDGAEVSDWAKEAVTEMVKNGTVAGVNGKLHPAEGSTRAEMAQLLYKLLSSN